MNTPSEHATFCAQGWLSPDNYPWSNVKALATFIDTHAIAPAVAERDKRIAELVNGFLRIASMTMSHAVTAQDGFTRCREIADEMLAKHGGSHE